MWTLYHKVFHVSRLICQYMDIYSTYRANIIDVILLITLLAFCNYI